MDQTLLLKIALFMSCVGLLSLLFIFYSYDVEPVSIFDAKNLPSNSVVKISGTIDSVSKTNSSTRLTVSSVDKITVVVFDDVDFTQNQGVIVEGEVNWFNGRAQIVANSVVARQK